MKKYFYLSIFAFIIFILLYLFVQINRNRSNRSEKINIPKLQDNNKSLISPTIFLEDIDNNSYKNSYIIIRDLKKIKLYSNLKEKLNSFDAKIKYNCKSIISAGFYNEDNNNIGLFIAENGKESDEIKSSFFNGYFYLDNYYEAHISDKYSLKSIIALQSGPILMKSSIPEKLTLENDDNSRRIIVATTKDNNVVFIVLYSIYNQYLGPKLSDVPDILNNINNNTNIKILDAINLDGGTHSVFDNEIISIKELSIPGGYFCIKS